MIGKHFYKITVIVSTNLSLTADGIEHDFKLPVLECLNRMQRENYIVDSSNVWVDDVTEDAPQERR